MMAKPKTVDISGLRRTHFELLLTYVVRLEERWYYGNQEQFEKQNRELREWLETVISEFEQK